MPKKAAAKAKPVDDDLDLDEDDVEEEEDEDTEEEDDSEDEDDEEDVEEDEEEEDDEEEEEEEEPKSTKKAVKRGRGRPPGTKNKEGKQANKAGKLGLILRNGIPKRVQIVKVMGKNVKICKPGSKPDSEGNIPGVRYPITEVYMYDEDVFEKMVANAERMTAVSDKNYALLKTLQPVVSNKVVGKRDPLEDF